MNIKIDRDLFRKFDVKLAYLFGSRAKNNFAAESDYDIAVLFRQTPSDPLALKEVSLLTLELSAILPAKVDVICLNAALILLKYEVIAHGRPLYCEDEKDRINFEVMVIKEYIDDGPVRNFYNRALYKRILQEA